MIVGVDEPVPIEFVGLDGVCCWIAGESTRNLRFSSSRLSRSVCKNFSISSSDFYFKENQWIFPSLVCLFFFATYWFMFVQSKNSDHNLMNILGFSTECQIPFRISWQGYLWNKLQHVSNQIFSLNILEDFVLPIQCTHRQLPQLNNAEIHPYVNYHSCNS